MRVVASFELARTNPNLDPAWTMTHSFHVVMGGFALKDGAIYRPVKTVDFPKQVGQQFAFPTISEEEIKDKSKGDGLTKTLAIFQLLWFSAQLVGRLVKGWAATELEVLTFATCIMTAAIYFFWWNKGLDVRCQTILDPIHGTEDKPDAEAHSSKPEKGQENGAFKSELPLIRSSWCHSELENKPTFFTSRPKPQNRFHRQIFEHEFGLKPFFKIVGFPFLFIYGTVAKRKIDLNWGPDCANPISPHCLDHIGLDSDLWEIYGPFLSASLFGAMHFITWSFTMPTLAELWMWRSASIALTAMPVIVTSSGAMFTWLEDRDDTLSSILHTLMVLLAACCLIPHPVIRLVIAVDAVVLLRDIPETAFLVLSWSDVIPSL